MDKSLQEDTIGNKYDSGIRPVIGLHAYLIAN